MRRKIQVACHILGLIVVIFSIGWGFWVELYYKKLPCILCFLQRASMFGMGIGLYWNLSLGIRLKQYALAVL
ncbi:MAG: hypothetical protein FJZ58_00555, partial [Chlamydiae bacterium]|nr:hypothetical protein [Chlamydiota bacterium]